MKYRLHLQIGGFTPGTLVEYDDEWNEWTLNESMTYGYRGSIGEGEIAMLLDYMAKHKLTSILEPEA